MKAVLSAIMLLWVVYAHAQAPIYYIPDGKDSIPVYPFGVSMMDTTIKVNFDLIDEAQFRIYEKAYYPQIDEDSTQVKWLDTTFVVKTNSSKFTFQYRQKNGQWDNVLYDYIGYSKPLNLYILTWVDANNAVAGQTLINKTTGKRYELYGFDNAPEVPLVSPDGNLVLVCATDVYESSGSFIELYDVNRGKDGIVLLERWRTDSKQEEYPDMTPEQTYQYAADQDLWNFVEVADTLPENENLDNPYQDYSPYMISSLAWINNTSFAFACYRIKYTEEGRLKSMPLFVKATICR